MSKNKAKYEVLFIVNPALDEKEENGVAAMVERFRSFIEQNGEILETDDWGGRKLAYPIDDRNEGYYYIVRFTAEPEFPLELERNFNITEGIMRYLVLKMV